jgi:hypothetical protein
VSASRDAEDSALLAALRKALAEPAEQRLYRRGKHGGLFKTRSEATVAAAQRALHDGLIEVVRTESRGKLPTEWVRLTPAGVHYLHAHESPRAVLEELRRALRLSRSGAPALIDAIDRKIGNVADQLTGDVRRLVQRLDALATRVEEALRRVDAPAAALANGVAHAVPWAAEALHYLDERSQSGPASHCPLPELFAAVRERRPNLSLREFHDGLRRLTEFRALTLEPFAGPPDQLLQPEFALLEGARVLYFVRKN